MEQLYETDAFVEETKEKPSEEDLELFRQQVAEWLKLDEHVRKLSVALRERKVHQRALAGKIQNFMIRYNYDNLNTQQGRIRSSVRTVKQPIRLSDVKSKLEELGDQPMTAQELFDRIFNTERPTTVKQSLRRVIPKVSLNLDI